MSRIAVQMSHITNNANGSTDYEWTLKSDGTTLNETCVTTSADQTDVQTCKNVDGNGTWDTVSEITNNTNSKHDGLRMGPEGRWQHARARGRN